MRSTWLRSLAFATGLSLASISIAGSAFADEPSEGDIAQARQLGGQAQEQMEKGNFAESEKLWAAAAKLYPKAPTLALGLARAAAKNGHPLLAQENYNRIIREWGNVASPPPAFKDALEAARAEVGSVSSRVASVVVTVEGVHNPTVSIDGDNIPAVALGLRRPVEPGKHTVHAEAPGYKPADVEFTVAEGGSATAPVKLEKAAETPAPGAATLPPAASPGAAADVDMGTGKGGSSKKTWALVAFGVGGAGLVAGAVTGLIAVGKHGDLKDKCPTGTCDAQYDSDVSSYKKMGTFSTIGFVVAGLGAGVGAFLWFTSPKESASADAPKWATFEPAKGVKMTPYVGVTNAGVTGTF